LSDREDRRMKTRTARVVIGANYGDEGKGLATDALAARDNGDNTAIIRFNGGAQAGHTVTTPDGRRHVFSHFGAGSLTGATTYLSSFFVLQPTVFAKEAAELAGLGIVHQLYADPDAQVTTPYDVMVNRWAEETRGISRHGSVGIGFGETVERASGGYPLAVRHLGSDEYLGAILDSIREGWLPARLAALGIAYTPARAAAAGDPKVIGRYLCEIAIMRSMLTAAGIDAILGRRNIIFEGAQGLLLDQDRGHVFPYLTRSNTGLKNVLAIAEDAGIERLDVIYMIRSYLTRHGAGPLRHEIGQLDFADVVDPTNRRNAWQGTLRFAPLDLDVLHDAIAADLGDAIGRDIEIGAGVGVSCLDQLRGEAEVFSGSIRIKLSASELVRRIGQAVALPVLLRSHGPTRERVILADRRLAARPNTRPTGAAASALQLTATSW
jgi:adenylosuccinate synthase